jgi:hypothetical protein
VQVTDQPLPGPIEAWGAEWHPQLIPGSINLMWKARGIGLTVRQYQDQWVSDANRSARSSLTECLREHLGDPLQVLGLTFYPLRPKEETSQAYRTGRPVIPWLYRGADGWGWGSMFDPPSRTSDTPELAIKDWFQYRSGALGGQLIDILDMMAAHKALEGTLYGAT